MTNFVLYNLEEIRAESIGCYGNPAAGGAERFQDPEAGGLPSALAER